MQTVQERREAERIKYRMPVTLKSNDQHTFLTNLTESGCFIHSKTPLAEGQQEVIEIVSDETGALPCEASVVWSTLEPVDSVVPDHSGMAMQMKAVPPKFVQHVLNLRNRSKVDIRQVHERYSVAHEVYLEIDGQIIEAKTENISRGGMYLAKTGQVEAGAQFTGQLKLPGESQPCQFIGEVVYCLDQRQAKKQCRQPGCGVQLIELSADGMSRLSYYFNRLRVHRYSPDRHRWGGVPTNGSLNEYTVPEIFIALIQQRFSGKLLLTRHNTQKAIYFKRGQAIFVESSLSNETLGYYLLSQGELTVSSFEEATRKLLATGELFGSILVESKLIEPDRLAEALIVHQEEKLFSTFPWSEGTYQLTGTSGWPDYVTPVKLRNFRILFSGLAKNFSREQITAWLGLYPWSVLYPGLREDPQASAYQLPKSVVRVIHEIGQSITFKELVEALKVNEDNLLPVIYGLIMLGKIRLKPGTVEEQVLDLEETINDVATSQEASPPTVAAGSKSNADYQPFEVNLHNQAEEVMFSSRIKKGVEYFRGLNFFEMLGADQETDVESLNAKYTELNERYPRQNIESVSDPQLRSKGLQLVDWIHTAFETLSHHELRGLYLIRQKDFKERGQKQVSHWLDFLLFSSLIFLSEGKLDKAMRQLESALSEANDDGMVQGFLGWNLFCIDPKKNWLRSSKLIDSAIKLLPTLAQLYYYRGQIFAYVENWQMAERHFSQALSLRNNYPQAASALSRARQKRAEKI